MNNQLTTIQQAVAWILEDEQQSALVTLKTKWNAKYHAEWLKEMESYCEGKDFQLFLNRKDNIISMVGKPDKFRNGGYYSLLWNVGEVKKCETVTGIKLKDDGTMVVPKRINKLRNTELIKLKDINFIVE